MEAEPWPEDLGHSPDQGCLARLVKSRDQLLVEMAATMIELETGSGSARRITLAQADPAHIARETSRLLAEQKIAFRDTGPFGEDRDVISRVRMAFIFTLLAEEAQSPATSTLLGFLHQLQNLDQSGVDEEMMARMWLLPSEIRHDKMECEDRDAQRHLDHTSLQAIVCRWRDLLQTHYPEPVIAQLHTGNWNSALRLLRGHPQLLLDLKNQILGMVRLQEPFAEILETAHGRERFRLPPGMEIVLCEGEPSLRVATASEILMLLGSRADYPLIFPWRNDGGTMRCLEILDKCPGKVPLNGTHHDMGAEMILLRVFRQVWGIEGQPAAEDFADPGRLAQAAPRGIEVDERVASETREAFDMNIMSAALSRVEHALHQLTLHLPSPSRAAIRRNATGLRCLMKKAGRSAESRWIRSDVRKGQTK